VFTLRLRGWGQGRGESGVRLGQRAIYEIHIVKLFKTIFTGALIAEIS
jgi:hypothetical protein